MIERFDIAGYTRISVDDELDRDNVSIENQKAIIADFVKERFPHSTLTFYEDRDRSGYTFEQREDYQRMRKELMRHKYDILIVKDFSRFSRRNSRGLVELEDLRDAGIRIISIGDGIDFPNDDDWLKIQFQFLLNEMPVTDTSKKVRNVIKRRQADGQWICAAPYGYIVNKRKEFEIVPTEADIVRKVFKLYNEEGWGYKKIANYLTEQGIPTPRMSEQMRKEAEGETSKRVVKAAWSIISIQGILDNDFYIGTLRQGKYTRAKINGKDVRRDEDEQIVIENHHQPIIDYRTFATTRALREKRTRSNYRGVKKYDNFYSGFLVCGDCGSPMFSMSRSDLKPAYTCGTYHRRGLAGCTSHHIRVDKLDELLKIYVKMVKENSAKMLARLNEDLAKENDDVAETEQSADHLAEVLEELREELKATKRQRIRDIMKHPEQEALLEETYDEMEAELQKKIEGINHQIDLLSDKRNTIIQVNRVAKTALDIFEEILTKEKLERNDLELLIDEIRVYEDHLELKLQSDIDALLRSAIPEVAVNFNGGIENILNRRLVQSADKRPDKVFDVNVISDGDPLEIYTDKDGGVIFKKYSLMGGLSDFAGQMCETLNKTTGEIAVIADRDTCISVAGTARRDLADKRISPELEQIMEGRQIYQFKPGETPLPVCDDGSRYLISCAAPILSEGDVLGCVLFVGTEGHLRSSDTDYKLAQTIAGFLGRHMES
ncbi:stage V sporulation T C-terminal domain-containing protein [Lawsonibacter celer]|uniref:stage V sporulation T C-terminal domain-containing protein n=1 Tax=Lawsonibacter celer TaxID=2986526 RepID=UPI001646440F|nr:stage V sporulation T C-terminal domain-containing protein [Lawsonibacter celer]